MTTEDLSKYGPDYRYTDFITEVALLSGRVELTMRLLSRIIGKMDPSFLDDPHDPVVQHRSQLIGNEVLAKLKAEALAQAAHDPDAFARLQRYFKDL